MRIISEKKELFVVMLKSSIAEEKWTSILITPQLSEVFRLVTSQRRSRRN
jgi:hypothetical protein